MKIMSVMIFLTLTISAMAQYRPGGGKLETEKLTEEEKKLLLIKQEAEGVESIELMFTELVPLIQKQWTKCYLSKIEKVQNIFDLYQLMSVSELTSPPKLKENYVFKNRKIKEFEDCESCKSKKDEQQIKDVYQCLFENDIITRKFKTALEHYYIDTFLKKKSKYTKEESESFKLYFKGKLP